MFQNIQQLQKQINNFISKLQAACTKFKFLSNFIEDFLNIIIKKYKFIMENVTILIMIKLFYVINS